MDANHSQDLSGLVNSLRGLCCWYVSCGGKVGASFELALGGKVPRQVPLRNPAHSLEFRQFTGEANLLVWCSWRLDHPDRPLTSSDDTVEAITRELTKLVETTIDSVQVSPPAWDLSLRFTNGLQLHIFCDHVPGDPSFDGNWELWRQDVAAVVGPGKQHVIGPRDVVGNQLPPGTPQPVAGQSENGS